MFTNLQKTEQQTYYINMLNVMGSLSKLFSTNIDAYLDYRVTENLFCKAFEAENLSRSDVSADAKKDKVGIGIKTFLDKGGKSFEKVAEFNKHNPLYKDESPTEKIKIIAQLRNKRLSSTKTWHRIENIIYHCITRGDEKIYVYECNAEPIEVDNIKITKKNKSSITFDDGINTYRFNNSKSTLFRQFRRENTLLESKVKILEDPFELLENLLLKEEKTVLEKFILRDSSLFVPADHADEKNIIYLPLYSEKKEIKYVPDRSGLNQWNAEGRWRDSNEVYIRIPAWIHREFPDFLPPRKIPFNLKFSNGKVATATVCQQGSKALMTNPNTDLGDWLLRGILDLEDKELVTYEILDGLGTDSVIVTKIDDKNFEIDVARSSGFEEFQEKFKS